MQNDKENKNDREFYVNHLIRGHYSANFNYDKGVITVAGGALTFFVVFIEKIVGDMSSVQYFPMMKLSWVFFALSLGVIMFRRCSDIKAHEKALKQLDKGKEKKDEPTGGKWNEISEWCLFISYILVIFGFVLAAIFIYKNI